MVTPHQPEAHGLTERTSHMLLQYERFYTRLNSSEWLDFLQNGFTIQYCTFRLGFPDFLVHTEKPSDAAVDLQPV